MPPYKWRASPPHESSPAAGMFAAARSIARPPAQSHSHPIVVLTATNEPLRTRLCAELSHRDFSLIVANKLDQILAAYTPWQCGCVVSAVEANNAGMQAIRELIDSGIQWPIIVVAASPSVEWAVEAMQIGAWHVFREPVAEAVVLEWAARSIAVDSLAVPMRSQRDDLRTRLNNLSPREMSVLRLTLAGQRGKQISQVLKISHRTVECDRSKIIRKLGAKSAVNLAYLVAPLLLDPDMASEAIA